MFWMNACRTSLRLALLCLRLALLCALLPAMAEAQHTDTLAALRQGFLHPPDDARPMVRWWWFGAAVVKPEILRELQQMKADGIGGAELAFVYPEVLDDPSKGLKNLPFLSAEMLDAVRYAQAEGRKLGLRIDVTLCSGWPYGGPNTPLSQAGARLRTVEVALPANAIAVREPLLGEGESFIATSLVNLRSAEAAQPCGFGHGTACGPETMQDRKAPVLSPAWEASSAQPLALAPVITVAASSEPRAVLFFIAGHTRQQVKRAAVGAEGYVLDPFSREAVKTHLEKVGAPLLQAFGSTPPYAVFSDSLEAYGADWTPDLPQQFLKRRGYDLLPHLPEFVAGGSPAAEKVRHDYGRTLTELVDENYLTQIDDWAKAHHTLFRSQTYGEPAVSFSSQRLAALAEGEGPQWRGFSTLRWASSANHVFGRAVTSGETFTWLHSPVFRATPLDMKAEADIDFIMGENQLVFHGWPYSPPPGEVPEPGWSLYAAAVFNDHNPWHPVMPAVTQYIARLSWLLRQGEPANQVAILLPTDDAWASFSPGHVSVSEAVKQLIPAELISTILSAGYNFDFIDADAIHRDGLAKYELLVLPSTDRIPVETLKKIYDWRKRQYAIAPQREYDVICYQRCPSIDPEGSPLPGMTATFLVADTAKALASDLHDAVAPGLNLLPGAETSFSALTGSLGYIHRSLPHADVYFLTNTSNGPLRMLATFPTKRAFGEAVDPDTGSATALGRNMDGHNEADVYLAPYESRVFLFGDEDDHAPDVHYGHSTVMADLGADWDLRFTGTNQAAKHAHLTDWTADPATLHYSGEGIYTRDFTLAMLPATPTYLQIDGGTALPGAPNSLPQEHVTRGPDGLPNPFVTGTGPGMHAWFDPPIREAALVTINGKPAGALWHPPYRLDVTKFLKPGTNHIEIRVYNTALNAWSARPPHDYKPLIATYGDRFQMQDLDKVKPLPSGILGSIHLVTETLR